jgi:hypothetical protein
VLGGLSAGAISIIATKQGVGVNICGNIAAYDNRRGVGDGNIGSIKINTKGNLRIQKGCTMTAGEIDVDSSGWGIKNGGGIENSIFINRKDTTEFGNCHGSMSLKAKDIDNEGYISTNYGGFIKLKASNNITNKIPFGNNSLTADGDGQAPAQEGFKGFIGVDKFVGVNRFGGTMGTIVLNAKEISNEGGTIGFCKKSATTEVWGVGGWDRNGTVVLKSEKIKNENGDIMAGEEGTAIFISEDIKNEGTIRAEKLYTTVGIGRNIPQGKVVEINEAQVQNRADRLQELAEDRLNVNARLRERVVNDIGEKDGVAPRAEATNHGATVLDGHLTQAERKARQQAIEERDDAVRRAEAAEYREINLQVQITHFQYRLTELAKNFKSTDDSMILAFRENSVLRDRLEATDRKNSDLQLQVQVAQAQVAQAQAEAQTRAKNEADTRAEAAERERVETQTRVQTAQGQVQTAQGQVQTAQTNAQVQAQSLERANQENARLRDRFAQMEREKADTQVLLETEKREKEQVAKERNELEKQLQEKIALEQAERERKQAAERERERATAYSTVVDSYSGTSSARTGRERAGTRKAEKGEARKAGKEAKAVKGGAGSGGARKAGSGGTTSWLC